MEAIYKSTIPTSKSDGSITRVGTTDESLTVAYVEMETVNHTAAWGKCIKNQAADNSMRYSKWLMHSLENNLRYQRTWRMNWIKNEADNAPQRQHSIEGDTKSRSPNVRLRLRDHGSQRCLKQKVICSRISICFRSESVDTWIYENRWLRQSVGTRCKKIELGLSCLWIFYDRVDSRTRWLLPRPVELAISLGAKLYL